MNSLPDIEKVNIKKLDEVIMKLDPQLYLIKMALQETGVNPMIIPKIIRGIGNLAVGSGYGKIQIFIQARVVTQVKGEESMEVNEQAVIDKV